MTICASSGVEAAVIRLYRRHAQAWAAERGDRLIERAWLDRFGAKLPPGAAILDIGCGSGRPIARHLISQGHRITGIDAAPEMIALCRSAFAGEEWRVADMRDLALGRRFAGLIAWDSFFHLGQPAQRDMFPVFAAHAAPGAALLFTSGPTAGTAIGSYRGEALHHASLDPAEYRALLAANGFRVVAHAVEDPDCGGHTAWLARFSHPGVGI